MIDKEIDYEKYGLDELVPVETPIYEWEVLIINMFAMQLYYEHNGGYGDTYNMEDALNDSLMYYNNAISLPETNEDIDSGYYNITRQTTIDKLLKIKQNLL